MLRHWNERALPELLAAHDLADVPEMDFQHDGWSGASLTRLARGDDAFILKRTAWSNDWIARATQDRDLREGFVATGQLPLPPSIVAPYLGAAADGPSVAMLMPDLSATLIDWERPDGQPTITSATLDRVLGAIVDLHHGPVPDVGAGPWPWCPLRERLTLLTRSAAVRLSADGQAAGARFLAGWAAFDALAPRGARDLIERLDLDPGALLDALADRPTALLHGDLKLANVALLDDGRTALIDWQMVTVAPVAVDMGWFLVSNSSALGADPTDVLARYARLAAERVRNDGAGSRAAAVADDWEATRDLAMIVGLLLRGWRKGLDALDDTRLASGTLAIDDLAWWCAAAVAAADRRLA